MRKPDFNLASGILPKSQLWEALMQTSRFQLGLIATLAVGLGFSLSSSDAVGYPAGAAVSVGSNPVWSVGGGLDGVDSVILTTAPVDQRLIVTDIVVSAIDEIGTCAGYGTVDVLVGGETRASVVTGLYRPQNNYSTYKPAVEVDLESGIAVGPGDELRLTANQLRAEGCSSDIDFRYTLSGYYAQP